MKAELKALKDELSKVNLLGNSDLVNKSLNKLSRKIAEVEKRMECVDKCGEGIKESISKYTERVDANDTFVMSVNDHDAILRGANDILIATDLEDNEPITENWYNLFDEEREEKFKPRTVSEYVDTLPKEEVKVIYPKGTILIWDKKLEYYIAPSGARAKLKEDYTTESEYVMVEFLGDCSQGNGGYHINMFKDEVELPTEDTIELSSGGIPYRHCNGCNIKEEETVMTLTSEDTYLCCDCKPPTDLCRDVENFKNVKEAIRLLKNLSHGSIDGETMEYIVSELGFESYLLRSLVMKTDFKDTKDLLREKFELTL